MTTVNRDFFPLKNVFNRIMDGADNGLKAYLWMEYISNRNPDKAIQIYNKLSEATDYDFEAGQCNTTHRNCHDIISEWVDYRYGTIRNIIQLVEVLNYGVQLFLYKNTFSTFIRKKIRSKDRDNPARNLYHTKSKYNLRSQAHGEFLQTLEKNINQALGMPNAIQVDKFKTYLELWRDAAIPFLEQFEKVQAQSRQLDESPMKVFMLNSQGRKFTSLIPLLMDFIRGGLGFFCKQNPDKASEVLQKFHSCFRGEPINGPGILITGEDLTRLLEIKNKGNFKDVSSLVQPLIAKHAHTPEFPIALERIFLAAGYKKQFEGYVHELLEKRDPERLGVFNGRIFDRLEDCPMDTLNYTYIQNWLTRYGPVVQSPKSSPSPSPEPEQPDLDTVPAGVVSAKKKDDPTDMSTLLLFGVGALFLVAFLR